MNIYITAYSENDNISKEDMVGLIESGRVSSSDIKFVQNIISDASARPYKFLSWHISFSINKPNDFSAREAESKIRALMQGLLAVEGKNIKNLSDEEIREFLSSNLPGITIEYMHNYGVYEHLGSYNNFDCSNIVLNDITEHKIAEGSSHTEQPQPQ